MKDNIAARPPEEQELIDLVRGYAGEMNRIHRKYAPLLRGGPGSAAVFDARLSEQEQVRRRYLTQRKRSYDNGLPTPPRFAALEDPETVIWVEIDGNRATVTTLTKETLDFRFTLRKKEGEWRIDCMLHRYHSKDRSIEYQWIRVWL